MSNGGCVAAPFLGPYAASKFALEALSDSLRRGLRTWNLPVVVIEPGSLATPISDKRRGESSRVRAGLSEEARGLYGPALDRIEACFAKTANHAIPADSVARAVAHALTSRRPRIRYRVGTDARISRRLSHYLPDRALDALLARMTGLP